MMNIYEWDSVLQGVGFLAFMGTPRLRSRRKDTDHVIVLDRRIGLLGSGLNVS